ncbi:phosphoribosyltransferase [Demequina sp.]|uniref:phosphoribosyltransferase n=1 Tax=Demequina sp. TaxID=2050685 RepID=UPI0025D03563|nr:phosphoribosyltransferase family protein [Demequina sp.]
MDRLRDRVDAGERVARLLAPFLSPADDAVALGLPRGGVPVAAVVADLLGLPLDVIVVRKLGAPADPEYGFGAIGEGGVRVLDAAAMEVLGITGADVTAAERDERAEMARRVATYREVRPRERLAGRTAVIVDDGIATGGTARAAALVARAMGATRVIVAAGVAAPESLAGLMRDGTADHALAALIPDMLRSVGAWYEDFGQTPDAEVLRLLTAP